MGVCIVVPSERKIVGRIPALGGLCLPSGYQIVQPYSRPIADNYNEAAAMFLDGTDDVFCTIEDDIVPPADALTKLLARLAMLDGNSAVGAWYPRRELPRAGIHMNGEYPDWRSVPDDGALHQTTYLGMGFSVYPRVMLEKVPKPLFRTFGAEYQDTYFSRKAREYGFKLFVDSSIKCGHRDRNTGILYT